MQKRPRHNIVQGRIATWAVIGCDGKAAIGDETRTIFGAARSRSYYAEGSRIVIGAEITWLTDRSNIRHVTAAIAGFYHTELVAGAGRQAAHRHGYFIAEEGQERIPLTDREHLYGLSGTTVVALSAENDCPAVIVDIQQTGEDIGSRLPTDAGCRLRNLPGAEVGGRQTGSG